MVGKQELKVSVNEDTVLADLNADYSIVSEGYKQLLSSAKCKSLLDSRKLLRDSVFQVQVSKCFGCDKNRKCFSFVREFEQKLLEDTDFNLFHEGMVMKINNLEGADDWESMNDLVETAIYSQPNLGKRIKARSNN